MPPRRIGAGCAARALRASACRAGVAASVGKAGVVVPAPRRAAAPAPRLRAGGCGTVFGGRAAAAAPTAAAALPRQSPCGRGGRGAAAAVALLRPCAAAAAGVRRPAGIGGRRRPRQRQARYPGGQVGRRCRPRWPGPAWRCRPRCRAAAACRPARRRRCRSRARARSRPRWPCASRGRGCRAPVARRWPRSRRGPGLRPSAGCRRCRAPAAVSAAASRCRRRGLVQRLREGPAVVGAGLGRAGRGQRGHRAVGNGGGRCSAWR